jgi:hypothetical protein
MEATVHKIHYLQPMHKEQKSFPQSSNSIDSGLLDSISEIYCFPEIPLSGISFFPSSLSSHHLSHLN